MKNCVKDMFLDYVFGSFLGASFCTFVTLQQEGTGTNFECAFRHCRSKVIKDETVGAGSFEGLLVYIL